MKKILGISLVFALLLSLAACAGDPEPTTTQTTLPPATQSVETQPTDGEPTAAPTEPPSYASGEQILVDDENVTFTVTGFENNEHLGLQVQVYCENKTDKNMMFSVDSVSVCGVMYDPFWAQEVAAGKKVNTAISFDTFRLAEMGVDSVDEISFTLRVIDNDEWMNEPFVDEVFSVYPTGLTADTVVYPEYQHKNGETVIVDNEDLLFIIEKVDDTATGYYTLSCYVVNRTDKNLLISWDGVSVNGFMVDPFWAAAVGAGKQLYTEINFFRSDLEAQGIETVTDIEFTLCAYDYDSFDGSYVLQETCSYKPE